MAIDATTTWTELFIIKTHLAAAGQRLCNGWGAKDRGHVHREAHMWRLRFATVAVHLLVSWERMFRLVIKHQADATIHRDACTRPTLRTAQSWSGWKQALTLPFPGQGVPN